MKEMLHTVEEYYDGVIKGIADFEGKPHYYERQFDADAEKYSDVFSLTPLRDAVFQFAMEQWKIWQRWETAFKNGKATLETHPALPHERARYDEIEEIVRQYVLSSRGTSFRVRGKISADEVEWSPMSP